LHPLNGETNASRDAEASYGLRFATDKVRSLSSTMRLLASQESEWVGLRHVQAWVMYWKNQWLVQ
jgi:hypothetical protein